MRTAGVRRYLEPFAGSACLFFAARPGPAVLGDLNSDLIGAYRTIRDHPRLVARQVHSWATDAETYYSVRAMEPQEGSAVLRAARFLFLNRLCFNGVYRTNRQGRFNVPYGRNTGAIPSESHIYRCSVALRDAELRDGDFDITTADVGEGDFVYLDPPYTGDPKRAYGVYGYGSFDRSELGRILETLRRIDEHQATFLFSYADIDVVEERLPAHWSLARIQVPGQIAAARRSRVSRTEILVSNRPLLSR